MKVPDVRQILADKASYVFMKRGMRKTSGSQELRNYAAQLCVNQLNFQRVVNGSDNNENIPFRSDA